MKDWRLGALHYFFQFLIALYIVGYVLLYDKVRGPCAACGPCLELGNIHSRTETSCAPGSREGPNPTACQEYLRTETPEGTVRVGILRPGVCADPGVL